MKFTELFKSFFTRKHRKNSRKFYKKKNRKTKRRYTMRGG
jgi:hypothetical protein